MIVQIHMDESVRNAVEIYLQIRICPSSPFPFPWRFRSIRSFPSFLAFFLPQTERRRVCHPLLAFPSRLPRLPWAARAICCMAPGAKSQKTHPGPACALPFLVEFSLLAIWIQSRVVDPVNVVSSEVGMRSRKTLFLSQQPFALANFCRTQPCLHTASS